jgi:hypothetical protein
MLEVWVVFGVLLALSAILQYRAHESVSLKGHTAKVLRDQSSPSARAAFIPPTGLL